MNILDLLFPKTCFGCKKLGPYVCAACQKNIKIIQRDVCPYCKKSSHQGYAHDWCKKPSGVDGLLSFFQYDFALKKIIAGIKYHGITSLFPILFNVFPEERLSLLRSVINESPRSVFVPVPLHPKKERRRGFNQSRYIAGFFAKLYSCDLDNNLLSRIKNTDPQAHMRSPKERIDNMQQAFRISASAQSIQNIQNTPAKVIIVDDVWTTGSTIMAATKALKKAGVKHVYALTVARTI